MWFLGAGSVTHYPSVGQVGRISPAGKVSRFPIPRSAGAPYGIAASGGLIWFGYETGEPGIATADREGRIRELPLPRPLTFSGYVTSVAAATGGGVWFVGNDPPILGQASADGEVRRTLLRAEAGSFGSLTVGREGDLWATRVGVATGSLLKIDPRIPGTRLSQLGALGPRGPVRVRVTCERGRRGCHGTVRISHERTGETCCGAIEVAFARYRIGAGGTKVVPVQLPRASRVELRRAARHGHSVMVGSFEPGGFASSRLLRVAGVGVR
jgi:streptogramin lyase